MRIERIARYAKGFSDPTRLKILWLLSKHPLCVCEIMGVLGVSQPKASRHLIYLSNAGLVESYREGRWVVYRIKKELPGWLFEVLERFVEAVGASSEAEELRSKLEQILKDKDYRRKRGVEDGR